MMKFNVVLFTLVAVIAFTTADLTPEQLKKLKEESSACIAETGVSQEVVEKARKGDFSKDEKLPKYAVCMAKQIGFVDGNGKYQMDVIKEKFGSALGDDKLADELIKKCVIEKPNIEDAVVATFLCYYNNTPKHISVL